MSFARLREIESSAGRTYWQTIARFAPTFEPVFAARVPEHWHTAGPRTSRVDTERARKAITPVHAALNYVYAILEVEATIAAHIVGFDPSLGIMHADVRYRGSLATDLMEPVRPIADRLVLEILERRALARGDVFETREGVCRIGSRMAGELAALAPEFRDPLGPHAEQLARSLTPTRRQATPLTRANHRHAIAKA